jgi:putative ABC transport system permease protein
MMRWTSATLWKYALRQLIRRPGRTLLTLVGIVLGVAAILGVSITTRTTRSAYHDMFEAVTDRAALEVVAEGLGAFDEAVAARLQGAAGVKAAVPVIQLSAALIGKSGPTPVLVLGADPGLDAAVRDYVLQEGRLLTAGEGAHVCLLEAAFARSNGFALGQPVRLWTSAGVRQATVVGLLESRGAATFNGGAVLVMPLTAAQEIFALPGQATSVQIVVADGARPQAVKAALAERLPTGLVVQAPGARGERAHAALHSIDQSLVGVSFCMLVAGAFVILNTFLMNLTERRRQLAILRALGLTRGQLTGLLLREALLLGAAGTIVGLITGYLMSHVILRAMEGVIGGVKMPDLRWTADDALIAVFFGLGMTLAATWPPARRASRRAPLEDLLAQRGGEGEEPPRWSPRIGAALLAVHLVLLVLLFQGRLGLSLLPPTMALGIAGSVLLIPLVMSPLLRGAAFCLAPLGFEGRLALLQLDRRRSRTGLTVGILAIAVFVGIGVGHALLASVRDARLWTEQVVASSDFYLRGTMPDSAYSIAAALLPENLEADLERLEGAQRVDKLNWILARANDQRVVVIALTDRKAIALESGDKDDVGRRLAGGEVVLGTALARTLGLAIGDRITLETRHGPQSLRVAGTANEYTIDGMALFMDWQTAARLFQIQGVHVFAVTARSGALDTLGQGLAAFAAERHLMLHSRAELRGYIDRAVARIVGLVWGMMTFVFLTASLGVANTLTMNVLEQTRPLGVLRALGLRRAQLAKVIVAQALAIGLISLAPGSAVGVAYAYLFNELAHVLLSHKVEFQLDIPLVMGCWLAAIAIPLLAAWLPARRAARLTVVEALQYE